MPGQILLKEFISRRDLKLNPKTLYVFSDNMISQGYGGQAQQMRGEQNAVGIPTKYSPHANPEAYFHDIDLKNPQIRGIINQRFKILENHLKNGGDIIFPKNGIGTGPK